MLGPGISRCSGRRNTSPAGRSGSNTQTPAARHWLHLGLALGQRLGARRALRVRLPRLRLAARPPLHGGEMPRGPAGDPAAVGTHPSALMGGTAEHELALAPAVSAALDEPFWYAVLGLVG